ncbi:MAG: hypothetical protein J6O49_21075 [Bacteroidaceae bacterium]|nr:hypothetical protein [Bacteroidaceae bacterium]
MMIRRRRTEWKDSALKNNATYIHYYEQLEQLAISMFEWQNLPDTMDERFLELTLFKNGQAVLFEDEVMGKLSLPVTTRGRWNVYNIPMQRRAYATNGYNKNLSDKDSVIVYNNMIRTNSVLTIKMYARKLYELDRVIDVNCRAQKTPVLITGSEQQQLTLRNVYMAYDGNQPVIYGDKNLDLNALKVFKTDAPYMSDKLYTLKMQVWNEALTYLGISNLNMQKKERLISDEVTRNMGGTLANRYSRLNARRYAAEEFNKMFGTNIHVDYREDFRELDEFMIEMDEAGKIEVNPMVQNLRSKSHIEALKGGADNE